MIAITTRSSTSVKPCRGRGHAFAYPLGCLDLFPPTWSSRHIRRLRKILESIPGVGLITAATAIAEIGDFGRFPDAKAIGRYAGLTPTGYSSADKHRLGRICKTGSPDLRWVLQQAAWTAIRCDPAMKKVATKISKGSKTRKKAAAVAVARKLLVLMWTLVGKNELYKAREPLAA